jgi:KDO2-lipid IV(A) lauroyltransferase
METLKGAVAVGFLRLFALLPWRAVQAVGAALGWLMWKIPSRSRDVVHINLSKCFPELSAQQLQQLEKNTHRDIGRLLAESACAWIWPADKTIKLIRQVEGLEVMQQALASGKGVIGIATHIGNWEVLNHYFCSMCNPIIFYRPPKLKALDDLLQKQRVQLGNRVAPSTKEGILSVIKEVRRGGVVGIPADPEPSLSAGIFVPFCGIQALTGKFVPGMLAGGNATAFFINGIRLEDGSGFKVIIEPAPEAMYSEDIEVATAAMSAMVEKYVRTYPSQYLWSMKRFKKRPEGEAKWY